MQRVLWLDRHDGSEAPPELEHRPEAQRHACGQHGEPRPAQSFAPREHPQVARVHVGHHPCCEERVEDEEREERLPVRRVPEPLAAARRGPGHDRDHDQVQRHDAHADRMREEAAPAAPCHDHQEQEEQDVERDADRLGEGNPARLWLARGRFLHLHASGLAAAHCDLPPCERQGCWFPPDCERQGSSSPRSTRSAVSIVSPSNPRRTRSA